MKSLLEELQMRVFEYDTIIRDMVIAAQNGERADMEYVETYRPRRLNDLDKELRNLLVELLNNEND